MQSGSDKLKNFLKTLGPGIVFASTCIGVSHFVQSTRAGGTYGFTLLWAVILANLFKYPFFEFASRYTNSTGNSLLTGYYNIGRWTLVLYFIITIASMFIMSAAVTFVSAGLCSNLFQFNLGTTVWSGIILIVCVIILILGKYGVLDSLIKVLGAVLLVSTLIAFFASIIHGNIEPGKDFVPEKIITQNGLSFIIALMGWMPIAVDMSVWGSLWTEARIHQTGYHPNLKGTLLDFNIGYLFSAILAVCFLTLGAMLIYGSGKELPNSSPAFASALINMYTSVLGDWSFFIIALAAFSTMFGTTITVLDGYCRAIERTTELLWLDGQKSASRKTYIGWMIAITLGAFVVLSQFANQLKALVDLATTISFVIAPLAGLLNYFVIKNKEVRPEHRPPLWLDRLAISGIAFLGIFTLIYVFLLINPEGLISSLRGLFSY